MRNRRADTLAEPIGQDPDAADLEDEVARLELDHLPQDGEDPGEARSVVVDHVRDQPPQEDDPGVVPDDVDLGAPGAVAGEQDGDIFVVAPDAPEGAHGPPGYVPPSARTSAMALVSTSPPPVGASRAEGGSGERGEVYGLIPSSPAPHPPPTSPPQV